MRQLYCNCTFSKGFLRLKKEERVIEVPFIEGIVTHSRSKRIYICAPNEFTPAVYLTLDSFDGELSLLPFFGRIDVGERVRLYCIEGFTSFIGKKDVEGFSVDYVEILNSEGKVINEINLTEFKDFISRNFNSSY